MKCWVCGIAEGDTREHFIKKSDLKDIFGTPTQSAPHYLNAWRPSLKSGKKPTTVKRNEPIRTLRSDELTYDARLCAKCNNEVTQPHDLAWEKLSKYLRKKAPLIQVGAKVRFHKIFGNDAHKSMLNVHLFFVKQFAGIIVDESMPISLRVFSEAILSNKPHPHISLVFISEQRHAQVVVMRSEVNFQTREGRSVAVYDYQVDRVVVRVIYDTSPENRKNITAAYHPSMGSKCIQIISPDQASHVESKVRQ